MKKYLFSLIIAFGLTMPVLLPASASAVDVFQPCSGNAANTDVCTDVKTSSANPIFKTLKTVLKLMSFFVGVLAIFTMVYGGFKLVTSQGDPTAVKTARSTIIYALAGVAVAALAQVIVIFVLKKI